MTTDMDALRNAIKFQSPHGDFGFLKGYKADKWRAPQGLRFQSPHGDFGFLKSSRKPGVYARFTALCFNPLTGILVF